MGFSSPILKAAARHNRANNSSRRGMVVLCIALGASLGAWTRYAPATVIDADQTAVADLLQDVWSARRGASRGATPAKKFSLKLETDIRPDATASPSPAGEADQIASHVLPAARITGAVTAAVRSRTQAQRPALNFQTQAQNTVATQPQQRYVERRKDEEPGEADGPSVTLRGLLRAYVNVRGPSGLPDLEYADNARGYIATSSGGRSNAREGDSILDTAISSQFAWLFTSIVRPSMEQNGSVRFSFAGIGDFMLEATSDRHYVVLSERDAGATFLARPTFDSHYSSNTRTSQKVSKLSTGSINAFVNSILSDLLRSPAFYVTLFALFVWASFLMLARAAARH